MRIDRLTAEGYDAAVVQAEVNAKIYGRSGKKTNEEIAQESILGKWGNGQERKDRLTTARYDYDEVQKRVNEILAE